MASTLKEYIQRVLEEEFEKAPSKQKLLEVQEDDESDAFTEAIHVHPI